MSGKWVVIVTWPPREEPLWLGRDGAWGPASAARVFQSQASAVALMARAARDCDPRATGDALFDAVELIGAPTPIVPTGLFRVVRGVFQDGADFYQEDSDAGLLWSAPFKVRDFDSAAADRARAAFLAWSVEQAITPEWEAEEQ